MSKYTFSGSYAVQCRTAGPWQRRSRRSRERAAAAAQDRPITPSNLLRGPTKCSWMLVADGRGISVVVQGHKFGTPEDHDLRLGREHKADRRFQGRGPRETGPKPLLDQSKERISAPFGSRLDGNSTSLGILRQHTCLPGHG